MHLQLPSKCLANAMHKICTCHAQVAALLCRLAAEEDAEQGMEAQHSNLNPIVTLTFHNPMNFTPQP